MADDAVRELTDADFDELVNERAGPVLVQFGAAWCAPCRMQRPVLEQCAATMTGTLAVAAVDVDVSPRLRERFAIRSVPMLVLFNQGKQADSWLGFRSREELQTILAAYVS
ncbi:MAG TPA: thioredoxin domain-containing protein [bacterium]|nr:thioredoxin domain-containing protein [bacterium]